MWSMRWGGVFWGDIHNHDPSVLLRYYFMDTGEEGLSMELAIALERAWYIIWCLCKDFLIMLCIYGGTRSLYRILLVSI